MADNAEGWDMDCDNAALGGRGPSTTLHPHQPHFNQWLKEVNIRRAALETSTVRMSETAATSIHRRSRNDLQHRRAMCWCLWVIPHAEFIVIIKAEIIEEENLHHLNVFSKAFWCWTLD